MWLVKGSSWLNAATLRRKGGRQASFRLLLFLGVAGLAGLTSPVFSEASAQIPRDEEVACSLHQVGGYTVSRRSRGTDHYTHQASGGVDYRCTDGSRTLADSAVASEASGQIQLLGNVRFNDPATLLTADKLEYGPDDTGGPEIRAYGNVRVTDLTSDAIISGDSLLYYFASEDRSLERMVVYGGEPHATVLPVLLPPEVVAEDTTPGLDEGASVEDQEAELPVVATDASTGAESAPPYEIDASRFTIEGRRFFEAQGEVVVTRDLLRALGDSLSYDQELGSISVNGNAKVVDESFELTANSVALTPKGISEEIFAHDEAVLVGSSVVVRATGIRMFMEEGVLNRLVALTEVPQDGNFTDPSDPLTGLTPGDRQRVLESQTPDTEEGDLLPAQPKVVSGDFNLQADSIDVVFVQEHIDVVTAVGTARTEAIGVPLPGDSLLPDVARHDWMEGDTIIAHFIPPFAGDQPTPLTPVAEAGGRSRLETVTAAGDATSLYRMTSSDSTDITVAEPDTLDSPAVAEEEIRLALHYVAGARITIYMDAGEVTRMEVDGPTTGYHLEPLPPAEVPPDSTAVVSDSASTTAAGVNGPSAKQREKR